MTETEAEAMLCGFFAAVGWRSLRQFELGGKFVDVVALVDADCIAVEVKLRDWKRAVSQAYLNKPYFHGTFIAIPDQVAARAEQTASSLGVGLISFDEGGFRVRVESPRMALPAEIESAITSRANLALPEVLDAR
jgi:hypothetical protein